MTDRTMKNVANFALYQCAWFVAVSGAARGDVWIGPAVMLCVVVVHLALVPERLRELRFLLLAGLSGTLADSALAALGVIAYPSSHASWKSVVAPPWIIALWIGFATLPRFSLAWLAQRPWLAALLGAVGGPVSYAGGIRLGAVDVGSEPVFTWFAISAEYALATPLLLRFAPRADELE